MLHAPQIHLLLANRQASYYEQQNQNRVGLRFFSVDVFHLVNGVKFVLGGCFKQPDEFGGSLNRIVPVKLFSSRDLLVFPL